MTFHNFEGDEDDHDHDDAGEGEGEDVFASLEEGEFPRIHFGAPPPPSKLTKTIYWSFTANF